MRIYSLIVLLVLPLAMRSCQPQGLPTVGDLVRGREVVTDSSNVIKKQGGYQGMLVIDDSPDTRHGQLMKNIITGLATFEGVGTNDVSIPEENIAFSLNFNYFLMSSDPEVEALRLKTRVMNIPRLTPFARGDKLPYVAASNILFVFAAGNTSSARGRRDLWSKQHPSWQGELIQSYNNSLAAFRTGKVIAATSATEKENGDVVPLEWVVQCGDIAEWCFTVLRRSSTSAASARLAAMSFYLAQLYPTAEEIIETLNTCAIDIGEPGIDREFGRGLANIVCAPVLEKELEAAMRTSSMTVHSPALERVLSSEEKEDCACVSFFSSVTRGFGTTVGHVGVSLADDVTLLAGRGFAPIGVESSLFIETNMFAEISYKRSLFKKRDHHASLIATHSRQWGDTSAHISRLGLQYAKQTDRYRAGIYAGYRHATIAVGLPGYKLANTHKVSFTRGAWEMRFALSVGL